MTESEKMACTMVAKRSWNSHEGERWRSYYGDGAQTAVQPKDWAQRSARVLCTTIQGPRYSVAVNWDVLNREDLICCWTHSHQVLGIRSFEGIKYVYVYKYAGSVYMG